MKPDQQFLFEWQPEQDDHSSRESNRIEGEIPLDLEMQDGDVYQLISHDDSILTHGLHWYPSAFPPELPRWLIQKYSQPGEWVLDPFAGSGATNVEALLAGRHSVGVDIDPFARMLSSVKTTPLQTRMLNDCKRWLEEQIAQYTPPSPEQFPSFPFRDCWFEQGVIEELTFLKGRVEALRENPLSRTDKPEADRFIALFQILLSSIVRTVSSADDQSVQTVTNKQRGESVAVGDGLNAFLNTMEAQIPQLVEFSHRYPKGIQTIIPDDNDARAIKFPDNTFDCALTSPPCINAVDYPQTHQLEIYWLGIERASLAPLKRLHIGTETVWQSEYHYLHRTGFPDVDDLLSRIFDKDPRRSYILYKFLMDMRENLLEVQRVLKPSARYVIVLGDTRIRGFVVQPWKYLREIARQVGYSVEFTFGLDVPQPSVRGSRRRRRNTVEHVLVLRNGSLS